jgi:hypothetical protein
MNTIRRFVLLIFALAVIALSAHTALLERGLIALAGHAEMQSVYAQNPTAAYVQVTRVPMPGEIPCLYCGIDFPAGRSWSTNATSGFLTVYGPTQATILAVFNKAEWSRVEIVPATTVRPVQ